MKAKVISASTPNGNILLEVDNELYQLLVVNADRNGDAILHDYVVEARNFSRKMKELKAALKQLFGLLTA